MASCPVLFTYTCTYNRGQINLEFVFYTLRCLRPSVPSVSSCMKFQVPGFVSPTKVSIWSLLISNYISILHSIQPATTFLFMSMQLTILFKMSLANPDIANNLYDILSFHLSIGMVYRTCY